MKLTAMIIPLILVSICRHVMSAESCYDPGAGHTQEEELRPLCQPPVTPMDIKLPLPSAWNDKTVEEAEESIKKLKLEKGGVYTPPDCSPSTRVAIVIPYRNRSTHLAHFLEIMHPFLQRQNLQYVIVLAHQTGEDPFLQGLLVNAGYLEALEHLPFRPDCFIFHDVDHLPERLGMIYECSRLGISQYAQNIDRFDYEELVKNNVYFVGGVNAVTTDQYKYLNGHSNLYMGWGLQDNDFYSRIAGKGLFMINSPTQYRYTTIPHVPRHSAGHQTRLDKERYPDFDRLEKTKDQKYLDHNAKLYWDAEDRIEEDGLNTSRNYYTLEKVVYHSSYTEFRITPDFARLTRDSEALTAEHDNVVIQWQD